MIGRFIKSYWFLILIAITVILSVVNRLLEFRQPSSVTPSPTTNRVADYKTILPGSTDLDEINKLLGFPVQIEESGKELTAEYRSTNTYRNHIVIYEDNVAALIKEMIISSEEKTASSITNEFGSTPYVLYERDPSSVFNLYVYPANGIAYVGADDGTLLEVWYFKPTTINEFINRWGKDYSTEKTTKKSPY